ncbi:MAG TPA: MATE family efflux transporter [Saprospiraceae bacterium]|nr:MATE family efflux transporter [Saprospiraceae bacterium]
MRLKTSYRQIWSISFPIMVGSAAQNLIVLSDNIFLSFKSGIEFASIGIVGVFYLLVASIGYGFSRGGQILIARKYGERNYKGVGYYFQALVIFELIMATILFIFLQFGSEWFFGLFLESPEVFQHCIAYIKPRSFGIFFSFLGVSLIALYTGIARTSFIIYDTILLVVINIVLNYVFIFGALGMQPMGIAGAGIASTIAEIVAFIVFGIYMFYDKYNRRFKLLNIHLLKLDWIKQVFVTSAPVVLQSGLGIGSWFVFFTFIENVGEKELEISNLIRNMYLILSVPCWGFSAGINTLVSNFIGMKKRQAVIPLILKTVKINVLVTLCLALPVVIFPEIFLLPLFGLDDQNLLIMIKPLMPVLLAIMVTFAIGAIYMNGLIGTGFTEIGLYIQFIGTVLYFIYIYFIVKVHYISLGWAWSAEIFYWLFMLLVCIFYMNSPLWKNKKAF